MSLYLSGKMRDSIHATQDKTNALSVFTNLDIRF